MLIVLTALGRLLVSHPIEVPNGTYLYKVAMSPRCDALRSSRSGSIAIETKVALFEYAHRSIRVGGKLAAEFALTNEYEVFDTSP